MNNNIFTNDLSITWKEASKCAKCKHEFQFYDENSKSAGNIRRRPYLLPCNHNICEYCLFTKHNNGVEWCTVCKRTFEFNKGSLVRSSFELNYYLLGMLNYTQGLMHKDMSILENFKPKAAVKSPNEHLCFECNVASNTFCAKCDVPYCKKCFTSVHKFGKILREHVLSDYFEQKPIKELSVKYCLLHKNMRVDNFCNDCNKLLCAICITNLHQSHSVDSLICKNQEYYGDTVDFLSSIEDEIESNRETQKMIESQKSNLETHTKDIIAEIADFCLEMHSSIQNCERNALLAVRDKMIAIQIKLNSSIDLHTKRHQTLCETKELLQNFLQNQPDSVYCLDVINKAKHTLLMMPHPSGSTKITDGKPIEIVKNNGIFKDIHNMLQVVDNTTKPITNVKELSYSDYYYESKSANNYESRFIESSKKLVRVDSIPRSLDMNTEKKSNVYVNSGVVKTVTNAAKIYIKFEKFYQNAKDIVQLLSMNQCKNYKQPVKIINGHTYLINNSMHDNWVRAKVLKLISDNKYLVYLIDYGSTMGVSKEGFRQMPEVLKLKPPCVTKCELFALKLKNERPSTAVTFLKKLLKNVTVKVIVIEDNQSEKIVDLILTKGKYTFSVRDSLIYSGQADDNLPVRFDNNMMERMNTYNKIKNTYFPTVEETLHKQSIKNNDTFDVELLHVVNPKEFYVGKSENVSFQSKLKEQLNNLYEKQREQIYAGQLKMPCAICLNGDWNRAVIEEIHNDGNVEIRLVDIGKTRRVQWYQLHILDDKFLKFDCYAFECTLSNIDSFKINDYNWTQSSIDKFKQVTETSKLRISVKRVKDLRCEVILTATQGDNQLIVNKLMAENNEAKLCESSSSLAKRNKTNKGKKVKILHIESPSNFYLQYFDDVSCFGNLHRDIQNYMNQNHRIDKKYEQWKVNDRCLVKTLLHMRSQQFWYRGTITGISVKSSPNNSNEVEKKYKIFLEDHGQVIQNIEQSNMTSNVMFKAHKTGATSCNLACIKPTGGLEEWSKTSIDLFSSVVNKYSGLFITIDQTFNEQDKISVFLWGLSIENIDPLAPDFYNYININKLLVNEGLAHMTGKMNTTENELYEQNEDYYQNIDKWVSSEIENVHKIVDTSTEGIDIFINDEYNDSNQLDISKFNIIDNTLELFEGWLPPVPIKKTMFSAYPTFVDNDGYIYLHDSSSQLLLKKMCTNVNNLYGSSEPNINENWHSGQPCLCRFSLDNNFYRAIILQIMANGTILVRFIDYGNIETCDISDLRNIITYPKIPTQANQYVLEDICPLGGAKKFSQSVLDAIHKCIVGPLCSICVCPADVDKRIKRCSIVVDQNDLCEILCINGLVDYTGKESRKIVELKRRNDELIEKQKMQSLMATDLVTGNLETNDEANNNIETTNNEYTQVDVESQLSFSPLEESTLATEIEGLDRFQEYKIPAETRSFLCKIMFIRSPTVIYIYPLLSEHISACTNLEHLVQSFASTAPQLTNISPNTPCLSYFKSRESWHRAVIEYSTAKSRRVTIKYVDILISEEVDINQLRQCPSKLMEYPLRAVRVNLYGIKPNPSFRCKHIQKELGKILIDEKFHARIITAEPILQVKLYRRQTDVVDILMPMTKNDLYSEDD